MKTLKIPDSKLLKESRKKQKEKIQLIEVTEERQVCPFNNKEAVQFNLLTTFDYN